MKMVGFEHATLDICIHDAQRERVVITRDGKPVALIIGVEGMRVGAEDRLKGSQSIILPMSMVCQPVRFTLRTGPHLWEGVVQSDSEDGVGSIDLPHVCRKDMCMRIRLQDPLCLLQGDMGYLSS